MSADLAVIVDDPSLLERAADPGEFLVQACERAKTWLAEALEHGDIEKIAEFKSQADAIRVYTMSKQLGKDAQLSATEIVRRAERGLGVAIRRGQADGSINRTGRPKTSRQAESSGASPGDFVTNGELYGGGNRDGSGRGFRPGIYSITDDVTDEEFDDAVTEAKASGDLSRTAVHRKIAARRKETVPGPSDRTFAAVRARQEAIAEMAASNYSTRQIAARIGLGTDRVREIAKAAGIKVPADAVMGRQRQHDSNRIVSQTVSALEGLAIGAGLVNLDDLEEAEIANWAASLTDSLRILNRLNRQLKEMTQ